MNNRGRRQSNGDFDTPYTPIRQSRRESFGDYLASRRGSLSDLVFTNERKLSKEAGFPTQYDRRTRHMSITNSSSLPEILAAKQRSTSLVAVGNSSLGSLRESRYERRSGSVTVLNTDRRFVKTGSLSSINCSSLGDGGKRYSKGQISSTRRRRWLRKIQSLQAFDSVLKTRQSRHKYMVRLLVFYVKYSMMHLL